MHKHLRGKFMPKTNRLFEELKALLLPNRPDPEQLLLLVQYWRPFPLWRWLSLVRVPTVLTASPAPVQTVLRS
jgi:hypothetical protein